MFNSGHDFETIKCLLYSKYLTLILVHILNIQLTIAVTPGWIYF